MKTTLFPVSTTAGNQSDTEYENYLQRINARFLSLSDAGKTPVSLFTTDVQDLWKVYLNGFHNPEERQYHDCHACRNFIQRFGGLVTIDEYGITESAIWSEENVPERYKSSVSAMIRAIRRARVTGVFLSSDKVWGTPVTGIWRHFAVHPSSNMVFRDRIKTAGQAMAEKREDFNTVMRALSEFSIGTINTALTLLRSDSLYRSEKVLGQAEWLHELHLSRSAVRGIAKENLVWRAISTAPAGFCHPRSSMIGTLLEDIAKGKDFGEVSRSFAAKMHPLSYQRPQAAPSSGAIAAAEKLVQQLGVAESLPRRFARLEEVQALWHPTVRQQQTDGSVFGHLKPKGQESPSLGTIPAQTMSWSKFQRTVLPNAERIQLRAPRIGPYTALVTAVNSDSPPILQWDNEGARNPFSWYFWNGGSSASSFGLTPQQFVDVEAVTLKPSMWNGSYEHQGVGVMFILKGAHETRQVGPVLFPEILKSEFHGIRSVIEAYSKNGKMEGLNEPHAAGVMYGDGSNWDCHLKVYYNGMWFNYHLDRWD